MIEKTTEKASMKAETAKIAAPVANPSKAIVEHDDSGGKQKSHHVSKDQTKVMRFIRQ